MRLRRGFWRDAAGNSAVELAMLGPLLVTVVMMVFEVGYQAAVAGALEYGAERAARVGVTGAAIGNGPVATDALRQAAIRNAVLNYGGGLLVDGQLSLSETSFANAAAAQGNTSPQAGPGAAGKVVRYDLIYVQPMLTGSLAASIFGKTEFTHSTSLVVVNEQFPTN